MATHVSALLAELERQRRDLRSLSTPQLNSQAKRNDLRSIAETYFSEVRPLVERDPRQSERVASVDQAMQELMQSCHKRGRVSSYLATLSVAKRHLITLDTELVASPQVSEPQPVTHPVDERILVTLRSLLPSAAMSYEQALVDLRSKDRISWRGPATDLREALRETLDHLAPDKDVEQSPGFKRLPDAHGPTMKQKVRFILLSRGISRSIAAPSEDAADAVDSLIGQFIRSVYTRSSVSTHTPTERSEVVRLLDFVRVALCELLEIQSI